MSTAAFSAGMVQWAAIQVALARKKYDIKYPKMYEGTDDSVFDCVQRFADCLYMRGGIEIPSLGATVARVQGLVYAFRMQV